MPRALVCALSLLLLQLPAAAQVPPTSPAAIGNVPIAQIPNGTTSTVGVATDVEFTKPRDGGWTLRDGRIRTDLLIAVSAWNRLALDIAVPLHFQVDANHVALGPVFLGGGIVLKSRPTGARGVAVALRIGSALPLDDVSTARVDANLGVAVDARLARSILVAAYATFGGSARYGLKEPAFQSFSTGAGLRVSVDDHLDVLAGLTGRIDAFGGPSVRAEAWAGLQGRIGHVFITGTVGTPLTEAGLLGNLIIQAGSGDGLLPPAEREDTEPPDGGCVETSCTPQQRKAVARAHAAHIEVLRKQLLTLADLIELRFHVHAPAQREREIVRLTIANDVSIANDAERKRELSIRFLVAALARGGIPIDRETAAALIDRTGWRVQVERDIDEPFVDYFTYDMRELAAAYAGHLRDNARRLAIAMRALREAWSGTDEIFLDIGRGHANGLIGVVNGVLDLPLAPVNLVQFLRDRPTLHIGRIPHLEYRSDWGRDNGAAVELGVALATMTKPGSAIFAGLGNTVAPAVMRIGAELSSIVWRGLPVGKILAAVLVKWMRGSIVAVKMHAAVDAGEIVRALITHQVRQPDGSYREMTADDFEQLVYALVQDAAIAKAAVEGERGIEEERARSKRSWWEDPNWRLPKNGTWSGEPGNSVFKPHNPTALGLKPHEVIEFRDGSPDFSPWMVEEFEVPGLNGEHGADRQRILRELAVRKGWRNSDGTPNASAADRWVGDRGIDLHHAHGRIAQLVPHALHWNVKHTGGAYKLRNGIP